MTSSRLGLAWRAWSVFACTSHACSAFCACSFCFARTCATPGHNSRTSSCAAILYYPITRHTHQLQHHSPATSI
eukprot:2374542-Prymnesium_polylepis.1